MTAEEGFVAGCSHHFELRVARGCPTSPAQCRADDLLKLLDGLHSHKTFFGSHRRSRPDGLSCARYLHALGWKIP